MIKLNNKELSMVTGGALVVIDNGCFEGLADTQDMVVGGDLPNVIAAAVNEHSPLFVFIGSIPAFFQCPIIID